MSFTVKDKDGDLMQILLPVFVDEGFDRVDRLKVDAKLKRSRLC